MQTNKHKYPIDLTLLEEKIGYTFKNKQYLYTALTHSSYFNEHKELNECNERLEFLGDSVLSLICSDFLYRQISGTEGDLTRLKALLVCEESLSGYAKNFSLGDYIMLGKGEMQSGRERPSILCDTVESVLGAVYLDGGLANARKFIEPLIIEGIEKRPRDYKTFLQEIVQKNKGEILRYIISNEYGPEHDKTFVCQVMINSNIIGEGEGRSKKIAEQQAAKKALELLGIKV